MSFNVKVSGTWNSLASAWVKVAGTWQQVQSAWVKVAGTWQQVLATLTPKLSAASDPLNSTIFSPTGGDLPAVSIRFNTNGDIEEATGDTGSALSYSVVGQWISDKTSPDFSGADWEVNFTVDSEDTGDPGTWTGATRGVFNALSFSRTHTYTKDGTDTGTSTSQCTITVREIADTGNSATRSNMTYSVTISI